MKIKLPLINSKKIALAIISLSLLSAIPYFAGSGLDNPEPIGAFLNGSFPDKSNASDPYISVFPNIKFNSPLTFTPIPNTNTLVVGQRDGKIYWFENNNNVTSKNLLVDLSSEVGVVWDGGFLGLSIHPEFGTPGKNYIYLYYTTKDGQGRDYPNSFLSGFGCAREDYWGGFLKLKRIEVNPNNLTVVPNSDLEMIKMRMFSSTHRGGGMAFGNDGFLYIPTGDQSAYSKPQITTTNLDGGVLRIDVDQNPAKSHSPIRKMPQGGRFSDEISGVGYGIPNDNPFLSPNGSRFEEYYTVGHRNPHRMTKDRLTGTFYIGEIGEGTHEEINVIKPGKNYGWPVYEGYNNRGTSCVNLLDGMPHEGPLVAFPRSDANALIGGYVYRGTAMPDYYGKYICADYGVGEEIWAVDTVTGEYETITQFSPTNIISFGEDNNGELFLLSQGNNVSLYKLRQEGELEGSLPSLLSETGAFSDLQTLEPNQGVLPYELIESFWSDGAEKKRWMSIPNNGTHNTSSEQILFSEDGDWQFPTGSVLIKHFELPINENNPAITKRLETRFSIKASTGSFYFATYKWNDAQTDAVLLASGLDENITITKADGSTTIQKWNYPSNQDCISCHNPETGGALGTNTRYLNSDYTYEKTGRTANQLVTLSHLGVLNETISDAATNNFQTYKVINDPSATIEEKARSYMDLNCAYCHRPGATGDRAQFDLRLFNSLQQTGLLDAGTNTPIGIPGEKILEPGHADKSILYHRTSSTDPSIMMPPISKNKVDEKAVKLIEDWINQMDPDPCANRIIMETFNNVTGTTIAELKNNGNYPENPSNSKQLNSFSIPVNVADNYGARVKGILQAPETGTYYFWVSGDDNVELNLSTDDNFENKTRIAYHNNWSNFSEWNKYATQKSSGINLVAGENYYIEALMNEAGGGDNLSVAWRKPSNGNGASPVEILPCSAFVDINTPNLIAVTNVSVSPNTAVLTEGETINLTKTITPINASDISVTWQSTNVNIATVSSEGLVTANSEGVATINVITNDGQFTATSTITVERALIPVTGISLSEETLNLNEGESRIVTATVTPQNADNKAINWTSSNINIVQVDTNGNVTAISSGDAIVTATTVDGSFTASVFISVIVAPEVEVLIAPNPADYVVYVYFGSTTSLNITTLNIYNSNNSIVKTFNNPNAVLDGENYRLVISDLPVGDYVVEGISDFGSHQIDFTIQREVVAVTGLNLDVSEASVQIATIKTLNASIIPSNASNQTLFWNSSNNSIATVDVFGNVSGISEGTALITATTEDGGFTASATITVGTEPISDVVMLMAPNPADYVVYVFFDSPSQLNINTLNIYNASNTLVKTFNNPSSVLVEGDNYRLLINDLPVGVYTVEGVSDTGTYQKQLIISRNIISVTGMSLDISSASMIVGEQLTIPVSITPNDATNKTINWVSSDPTIATVNSSGTVTAVSTGEVLITATTVDGNYEDTATISVDSIIMLIAPNPATFVFYVYFYSPNPMNVTTINIYDTMGRLVKTFANPSNYLVEGNNYRLLVNDLPSGYYFIEGITTIGSFQKQVIIE
ncbi:Ig-like domain-containing protein [Maribacter hydrothermalis]|uniref:PA14 domain-containing protein n=1 Tax=Maribacter hydrothermalis TaxID=1836467 RepID=A0A1B7ZBF5_9FLAO|nr:Ig-like domain-containing protein [Maribacter hydrothermalis]APQ16448.1 hypothetical protein BTR34_03465 [Maribacter hydrothermalis]OBR40012.1 hypothetical protein A9200_17065 [Maribacter hydrothermalis]